MAPGPVAPATISGSSSTSSSMKKRRPFFWRRWAATTKSTEPTPVPPTAHTHTSTLDRPALRGQQGPDRLPLVSLNLHVACAGGAAGAAGLLELARQLLQQLPVLG